MRPRHTGMAVGDKLVARFGQAILVKRADGKWQLKGGSRNDRITATEWISLFMHEVVLAEEKFCARRQETKSSRISTFESLKAELQTAGGARLLTSGL